MIWANPWNVRTVFVLLACMLVKHILWVFFANSILIRLLISEQKPCQHRNLRIRAFKMCWHLSGSERYCSLASLCNLFTCWREKVMSTRCYVRTKPSPSVWLGFQVKRAPFPVNLSSIVVTVPTMCVSNRKPSPCKNVCWSRKCRRFPSTVTPNAAFA